MTDLLGAETLESMSQAVWYNKWTVEKFKQYLGGDILEIGCGIGNFTDNLKEYGNVWAIDINEDYVKQTRNLVGDKVNVGIGDVEKGEFFFKDRKFDCIVCLNVLEHIENDSAALKNMFNLLEKDGTLILLVPAFEFLYGEIDKSIGHFRRYQKSRLKDKLKEIGFSVIYSKIINFLGAVGWLIFSKFMRNSTVEPKKIKIFNLLAPAFLFLEDIIEPPFGTSIIVISKK